MAYKTLGALITATEKSLYQSAGPQVQLYSQDLIAQMIQDAFDHHQKSKDWWPQFYRREVVTLDGATGRPVTAPTTITNFDDIRYLYRRGSDRPLPLLPLGRNTLQIEGATPQAIEAVDDDKLFRIWPLTSTGDVLIVGRVSYDAPFVIDQIVPFDPLALRYFALWSYFTDDDALQSAAKYKQLHDERLRDLRDAAFNQPIILDDRMGNVPDRWSEYPW